MLPMSEVNFVTYVWSGHPALKWRLPTHSDFSQAEENGISLVLPAMQGKSFRAENNNERRSGIFRFTGKKTRYSYDTEIGDDISYSEVASSFANVRCLAHN